MRKRIVVANWKMNKTPREALELVELLKEKVNTEEVDVVFCVPFVDLIPVADSLNDSLIKLGAQNVHFEDFGPYTGEISAPMLKEIGCEYVIIGHSERRAFFNETDHTVNQKIFQAVDHDLTPIVCVGEDLETRKNNIIIEQIRAQIKRALKNVSFEDVAKTIFAYEPIWAIGTGMSASSEQAQEVCHAIRQVLAEIYDHETANSIRILYGGSVTGKNCAELFAMKDIDGGLVGGSSLKEDFAKIVNCK
jgi:triosephosphate isomerase